MSDPPYICIYSDDKQTVRKHCDSTKYAVVKCKVYNQNNGNVPSRSALFLFVPLSIFHLILSVVKMEPDPKRLWCISRW